MSRAFLVLVCAIATACLGCASGRPPRIPPVQPASAASDWDADAVPASARASALIFRPSLVANDPPLELSRADRAPSAFIGYEEPITEYYQVYTYDQQGRGFYGGFGSCGGGFGYGGGCFDRYERTAVILKTGVLHR